MKSFLIIILLVLSITLQVCYRVDTQKEIKEISYHIDSIMVHRVYIDSLYWDHLENCAFVNREEIKVGHQGYLYSTYHRNNIK